MRRTVCVKERRQGFESFPGWFLFASLHAVDMSSVYLFVNIDGIDSNPSEVRTGVGLGITKVGMLRVK